MLKWVQQVFWSASGRTYTTATAGPSGRSTRQKMSVALWLAAAAVTVLAATATVALVTVSSDMQEARASHAKVQHTLQVLHGVEELLSGLFSAQSFERAFVITGDPELLVRYQQADRYAARSLTQLGAEVKDPEAWRLFQQLESVAQRQLATQRRTVDVKRSGSVAGAGELVQRNIHSGDMDRILGLIGELEDREKWLLDDYLSSIARHSVATELYGAIALYTAIALMLLAAVMLARYNRRRLHAERESSKAYARLHATLERISQGVAVFDGEMRPSTWNRRFGDLCGLRSTDGSPDEFIAELVRSLASEKLPQRTEAAANATSGADLASAGEDFDTETSIGERELQLAGRTMSNGEYVVTLTDVTALKRSEIGYRDQAIRLNTTLDSIQDAIVVINESGSIETWSKGAEAMFGYLPEEVLRRNVSMLMPESHAAAHDGYLRRYVETDKSRIMGIRREFEARHKDGRLFPVELGVSEIRLGSRRVFIGIIRDISVRRQVDRLKSGFISTVSHELRTPLTSISGSLGLLAGGVAGPLGGKAKRLVHIAQANSERLLRLISDILDLDKAESGGLQLNCGAVWLHPVVRHAMDLNQAYARNLGVKLEFEPAAEDAEVFVDRDRLIQVLTNLIANAAKFSPPGERVRIRVVEDRERVRIEVIDSGPGISNEFRERIFQKFAQADSSDSRAKGGTGLGLSIAKTLIERMGGWIGFSSEPGQGATFHVTLSLHAGASPQMDAQTGSPLVLICEDDPELARHAVDTLADHGIRTEWAADMRAARAALRHSRFDAAVVDLDLPDGDGLELITTLRADYASKDLPVVVWTVRSRADGSARPIDGYRSLQWLRKPTVGSELLDAVRTSLARPRGKPHLSVAEMVAVPHEQEA